jgi:hypothetical protein
MSEYVVITKDQFEHSLGEFETINPPRVQEYVYKVKTENPNVSVVIYSSIDKALNATRSVGTDAIRIVLWNDKDNYPLGKGKRIYRVTSVESVAQRIQKTLDDFTVKARTIVLLDWTYIEAVLRETAVRQAGSTFVQSLYSSIKKYKKLTTGQLAYVVGDSNPKGRPTFEGQLKSKGWEYTPVFEEDITEELTEEQIDHIEHQSSIEVITDTPNMELVSTQGYNYKFDYFNPVQSLVHPLRNLDCNLVISSQTSSGKTICAEILMTQIMMEEI